MAELEDLRADRQEFHEQVPAKQAFETRNDMIEPRAEHRSELLVRIRSERCSAGVPADVQA